MVTGSRFIIERRLVLVRLVEDVLPGDDPGERPIAPADHRQSGQVVLDHDLEHLVPGAGDLCHDRV